MRTGTASNAVYSTILWLPILGLIAGVAWVLMNGMAGLEAISYGTEWFVGNDETANVMEPIGGGTYEDQLIAAMDTGDPEAMQAALDRVEAQQQAIASNRLAY